MSKEQQTDLMSESRLWPAVGFWGHFAVVVVLALVCLFSYANTLHNTGFALDNKFIILEDPRLREVNLNNLALIFNQDYWFPKAISGLYRPLTTLSYLFNYSILGNANAAAGYHWINLGLHWLVSILVYLVALLLVKRAWPAFFIGALFATHPVATESVANLVGRGDLLATISVLAGFLCYVKSTRVEGRSRWAWLTALAAITLSGVFCKESGVVVIGAMGLYDLMYRWEKRAENPLGSIARNAWFFFRKGYVVMIPPLVVLFSVRSVVFGKLRPPELPFVDNPLIDLGFWEARLTAIKILGKYFMLLLWPAELSCDYSYNQIPLVRFPLDCWEDWKALVVLAGLIGVLWLAIYNWRRNRAVSFFILFTLGTFLPASNLFPKLGDPLFKKETWVIGSIMAERFMYMPMIGFVGCFVIAMYAFWERLMPRLGGMGRAIIRELHDAPVVILSVILVGYAIRTVFRNPDWEDDVMLWTSAAKVCPDSFKSHKSLAFALYEVDPGGRNIDRIISEGEKAIAITDRTQVSFLHLGSYYRIKGDLVAGRGEGGQLIPGTESLAYYRKSVTTLKKAIELDHAFNADNRCKELARGRDPGRIPDVGNEQIYGNIGAAYLRLGELDEAYKAYSYAFHLSPASAQSAYDLASYYLAKGDKDQAAVALMQTIVLDPNRQEARRQLTQLYLQLAPDSDIVTVFQNSAQPVINPYDARVREDVCLAYLGIYKELLKARYFEMAEQIKQRATIGEGCPAERFQ